MSDKAHVVLQFGSNRIEMYRHWGGSLEITGLDLLNKLADAPEIKERNHFHDGGYVLRQLLSDSDGSLPQYQIIDGLMGCSWDYGYCLSYVSNDMSQNEPEEVSRSGSWAIYFAKLEGWEKLEDWLPHATMFSIPEFIDFVAKATDIAIQTGKTSDLDSRDAFLRNTKQDPKNE